MARNRGHRWPERLRKIQPERRHQLGAGRAVGQEPARRPDGRRDLRRDARPKAARHGVGHDDAGAGRDRVAALPITAPETPNETSSTNTVDVGRNGTDSHRLKQTESGERDHHHAASVPLGRERIPDRRRNRRGCAISRICFSAPAWDRKATPSSSRAASGRF